MRERGLSAILGVCGQADDKADVVLRDSYPSFSNAARILFPAGLRHKKAIAALLVLGSACLLAAGNADAFTAPVAGSFAYDIYDVGVNDILKGPIGFAAGVGSMVAAAVMAIRQMLLPAAATVLGGAFLLKADNVVTSLGALIR